MPFGRFRLESQRYFRLGWSASSSRILSLYEPVLIPNRNKEPTWAGERPFAVVGAKAGNTVQVMPVGAEQVGQKLAAPLSLGHTSVSVFSDAIFG